MRLAHIHIPKTAGHTIRASYQARYPNARVLMCNNPVARDKLVQAGPMNYSCISGHMPLGEWPPLPGYTWVAILREPVARTVSHWNYTMHAPKVGNPVSLRMRKEGWAFRDFIRTEDPEVMEKIFSGTFYLGGGRIMCAARELWRLDWVGTMERLAESMAAFGLPVAAHKNHNPAKHYSPTEGELAYLRDRLRGETLLYEQALEREQSLLREAA